MLQVLPLELLLLLLLLVLVVLCTMPMGCVINKNHKTKSTRGRWNGFFCLEFLGLVAGRTPSERGTLLVGVTICL
jgi:hypothetical protein